MTVNAYLRPIGTRLCATFDNEKFYCSHDESEDSEILADAGVTRDQLPADVQLPRGYYHAACLLDGDC